MKQDLFPNIVGQDAAKRKLSFYVDSYLGTGIVPNMMFVSPKGCGKTTVAKAFAKNLTKGSAPKDYVEVNCSTIKNVRSFFTNLVQKHMDNRDVTVLFDEASELPQDVTMSLLTILNPNPTNKNSFTVDDYTVEFDFSRQTFLFATSEAQQVNHALLDRLDRIDLEEYTYAQLGQIVQMSVPNVVFEDGTLEAIATTLRGNARAAQKMAQHLKMYLKSDSSIFVKMDWSIFKAMMGILPLGLNRIELQLLQIMEQNKDCSLTNLSAKTGLTRECVQRDFEMYLQKMNLMRISTSGRNITPQGLKYLQSL